MSVWLFGYGAAAALIVSFAALAVFWPEAQWEGGRVAASDVEDDDDVAAPAGWPGLVLRVLGVALLLTVLGAAIFGDETVTQNLAPVAVYVLFWVGLTVISALVADVWNRGLNPFLTLGRPLAPVDDRPYTLGHWPAARGLLAFVWLELVFPNGGRPSPPGSACWAPWHR
ncbi:MAG: hypothetical protein M3Q68_10115 [Actinomycetota bacterium]|nr:hypothetical protein [Actinomycetota bacterium]